jgi:hypothetical protein
MRPLALLCSLLLLPVVSARLLAQQPFSQLSPADLTHAFVQHAQSAPDNQQNYTFLILHRDLNYIHGKLSDDQSHKSEQVFIGGLPYIHRLEHNGKPLKGKELQHEDELYAKTLQERTGLTDEVRRKLLHAKSRSVLAYPLDQLESQFHPEITGHPTVDGHPSILLEFTPLHPDAPPALQRHILLTLDAANLNILQSHTEFLAPDNGFSKNTVIEFRNTYISGVLLPAFISFDTTLPITHFFITMDVHDISTDEFSNYRRFTTTVTRKSTADPDVPASPTPPPN